LLFLLSFSAFAQERDWNDVEISGLYVFGHATSTIAPCSSGQPSWLDGNNQGTRDLHAAHDSSGNDDLEPLYVVARGKLDPDYDNGDYYIGWFVMEELVEFSADPDVIAIAWRRWRLSECGGMCASPVVIGS
jgi:hypothetical protein